jgi:hypothetical protein
VEFLGLVEGRGDPENRLSGLFAWTCPACGAVHQETAVIQPNRTFEVEWSCRSCARTITVRCKARASTEWIAQHASAVAGHDWADEQGPRQYVIQPRRPARRTNQRTFACIAIPALAGVILLGLMSARRIPSSSASTSCDQDSGAPVSYSWLGGYWVSKTRDDVLFFSYMNPTARGGAYVRLARRGQPGGLVRFQIVTDDGMDERLVLRETAEPPNAAASRSADEAILYVSRRSNSMIRTTSCQGELIVTPYDHVATRPADD